MSEISLNEAVLRLCKKAVDLLRKHYGEDLVSVCLFGSAARGTLRKGSDIDFLLVVKEAAPTYHKRVKDIMPLVALIRETDEFRLVEKFGFDLEPSFLISTVAEVKKHPPLLIELAHEGNILFDTDGFLKNELDKVRDAMINLGSIRKETAHGHYWVLKPGIKRGEVITI